MLLNGGIAAVGVWPAEGREDLKSAQAAYVTMIKRHFDAICVASVHVEWPDKTRWTLCVLESPEIVFCFLLLFHSPEVLRG